MKRTLRLSRTTLTELTTSDLAAVAGGEAITQWCNTLQYCNIITLPIYVCLEPR